MELGSLREGLRFLALFLVGILLVIAGIWWFYSRPATPPVSDNNFSRADLGEAWPFTAEAGVLACEGSAGSGAVTFRTEGTVYAVNGVAAALAPARGWQTDLQPVVRSGVTGYATVAPVVERGLTLCRD
ncbi:DUF2511 domain-containing protein [Deinococcus sp. Leaf326]|uniref:DUF2511 domain-containing protein n=1 Tax=Deinococcus sp. Leaf326 TaxID=1736338 RepID=UPI000AACCD17